MNTAKITEIIRSAYRPEEYPVLVYQTEKWSRERPLEGKTVLDATPVFRNTMAKHLALLAAGAKLVVGISDLMPYDRTVVAWLTEAGIPVIHANAMKEKCAAGLPGIDIILDCAASFIAWKAKNGYVELTRSGVDAYTRSGKTVFMADSGNIKKIETCLGTGESYFRAMQQLGHDQWRNKRIVIFGSGKVGTGIAVYAKKRGASITLVTDPGTVMPFLRNSISRIIDFNDRTAVENAVKEAYAIVTATGIAGAAGNCCSPGVFIRSGALLANMGVEDEYGAQVPAARVLVNKQPINFILEEPTQMKYIDATMGLHNEGAFYLTTHPETTGLIVPTRELENSLFDISIKKGTIAAEISLLQ